MELVSNSIVKGNCSFPHPPSFLPPFLIPSSSPPPRSSLRFHHPPSFLPPPLIPLSSSFPLPSPLPSPPLHQVRRQEREEQEREKLSELQDRREAEELARQEARGILSLARELSPQLAAHKHMTTNHFSISNLQNFLHHTIMKS